MELHDFEQRLVEEIADQIATVATRRFEGLLAEGVEVLFDVPEGGEVRLIAVDHYDVGGMLLNVEREDGSRYLVRFEIRSGHYGFEAVPFGA
jgi:hypothetical protein